MRNQKARVRYQKLGKEKVKAPVCPYCGRVSVLRPAEYVHGEKNLNPGENLYVCSGYPECDAYVGVVRGSRKAKGTLAADFGPPFAESDHRAGDNGPGCGLPMAGGPAGPFL